MSEDLEATICRLRETVRVAKLAATHRLGQMRRLLMHEKHKTWKREFGFDCIETAAEMDEKRARTSASPVPNPFFYRNMVIPRQPHTPEKFSLEMKVDVEGLRMEITLSQSTPSECDPSPRRAAVDTGSEEPGTPPKSPAISTGSEEPGASRAETQKEENSFRFGTIMDDFCVQPAQAPSRSIFWCKFNQKSEWTTTTTPPHNKPPLARYLRDYQLASSKG